MWPGASAGAAITRALLYPIEEGLRRQRAHQYHHPDDTALLYPIEEGLRQPDSVFEARYIQRASVFHQKKDPMVPEPVFHSHFQGDVIVFPFFH